MGTAQTSYTLNNKAGIPGMLYDKDASSFIDSKPCGALSLKPGLLVELVNGLLVIAQGTGNPNANAVWGVVVYKDSLEPNPDGTGAYTPGMEVAVLRQGRIWVLLDSGVTFGGQGVAVNYTHSSDASHGQGTFTNAVVSGTVGQEVSAATAVWWKDGGLVGATPSIACVSLNLP
jgi:hypothetical protein